MYNFEEIRGCEYKEYGLTYSEQIDILRESFFNNDRYGEKEQFYYSFGGAVCGPLFTFFCEWAVDIAVKENIKLIFPLMREGRLYSKLLNVIIGLSGFDIKVTPIYVSRRSSYYALCYDKFDRKFFYGMIKSPPFSVRSCFHKLGIEAHSDIFEDKEDEIDALIRSQRYDFIEALYCAILERGLEEQINTRISSSKTLLHEYLLQNGASENFVTIDFGSMGTIPQAIDNCSLKRLKKIHIFLEALEPVKGRIARGHDIRYLLDNFENGTGKFGTFFTNFANHFFETITMGNTPVGTAIGYEKKADKTVQVICDTVTYSDSLRKAVDIIQDGIVDFCIQYTKYKIGTKQHIPIEHVLECAVASFCRLIDVPLIDEVKNLGWFEYDDSMSHSSVRYIDKMDENGFYHPLPLPEKDFNVTRQGVSKWPQGSLLINTELEKMVSPLVKCHKVVVYGCGHWGKITIEQLVNYDARIVCIVDKKQAGGVFLTYPIISIDELIRYDFDEVIIASIDFADEISVILKEFALNYSGKFRIHRVVI